MSNPVPDSVTEMAIRTFGSDAAAEQWLSTPAIALNGFRPLDLLHHSEGVERVIDLLVRIDYCVYT
jgi:putative toxin-antitoxin system antitoxin component (TIGR02293 family)